MTYRRALVGITLAGLLLGAVSLAYPRTPHDHSVYAYIAFTMLDGGVPYRDAWDVKGPGIFLWTALSAVLFGRDAFAMHLFDVLWQLLTALTIGALAYAFYRDDLARLFAALAWLIYYFSQNQWNWVHPESLSVLPLAAAFLALFYAMQSDRPILWLLAGFSVGTAILFKLPFGLVGLIPLVAAARMRPRTAKPMLQRLATLAAGAVAPMAIWIGYAAMAGGLAGYIQAQFAHGVRYTNYARSAFEWQELFIRLYQAKHLWLYGLGAAVLIAQFFRARHARRSAHPQWILVFWFVAAVVVALLHGTVAVQHLHTLAPPIFVMAAGVFVACVADVRRPRPYAATAFLLATPVLLAGPSIELMRHARFTWNALSARQRQIPFREAALYVHERTRPEETIYVAGQAVSIYLLAERKSASRFVGLYPLMPQWKDLPFRDILMQELRTARPSFVVLLPQALSSAYPHDASAASGVLADFHQFTHWLAVEYELELATTEYGIYRRKTASPYRSVRCFWILSALSS